MSHLIKIYAVCKFSYFRFGYLKSSDFARNKQSIAKGLYQTTASRRQEWVLFVQSCRKDSLGVFRHIHTSSSSKKNKLAKCKKRP